MRLSLKPFACIAAIIALAVYSLPVLADDKQSSDGKTGGAPSISQIRADCAADRKKHCSNVKRSRLTACLIKSRPDLMPSCRGHIDNLITARTALRQCDKDVKKHCAKAGSSHSQVFTCLADNRKQLSPTCQTSLAEARRALKN